MSYCVYHFCCYHLADIMSRAVLLYGDQALLDKYNERVAEKLNTKSSVTRGHSETAYLRPLLGSETQPWNFLRNPLCNS